MEVFADFLDFVEYSTNVEDSDGHEKNFWALQQIKITPKKFCVNWIISFENIDGGYPPPKKKNRLLGGGPGLSST